MSASRSLRMLANALALALFSLSALAAEQNGATTEHTSILLLGKQAGQQTAHYAADGSVQVTYEFNDRGRGPKIEARYWVAADGTLTELDTAGLNYLKAPAAEHFKRGEDGAIRWKNASEDGQLAAPAKGFYISLESTPEELVLLARAALRHPDQPLPLLPVGEVTIKALQ